MRSDQRGFTLIELFTVLIVVGLLASLAAMKYVDLKRSALTTSIAADMRAVQLAVFNYWADFQTWPPDSPPGVLPPGLAPYTPGTVQWAPATHTLDYEVFPAGSSILVGVSVTTPDPVLRSKLVSSLGGTYPFFASGGTLTYILVGPDGL